jgi:cytochrome c oxidase accessory protein FixG
MCPWPRIQAALTDEWALNVSYRVDRGEPRGSAKKNKVLRAAGKPAGDCVDCGQCVAVCPTGVDIREGLNMGCIQCGLCIDACDTVMKKIGREPRLIAYDTDENIRRRSIGEAALKPKIFRARTIVYMALIAAVAAAMGVTLATRHSLGVDVMHDRNPIYVALSDGSVRNAYTVRALNQKGVTRDFKLSLAGLPQARIEILGQPAADDKGASVSVAPDQTLELRVLVTMPPDVALPPSTKVQFVLTDIATGESAGRADFFKSP